MTVVSQAPSQSSSSTRSFWCPVPPTPKETRCANNPGERSAQTDAGTRHHCTAPPTDQAVPPGNWSLDQGTPQRGRHGHRAIHRPALLRGTAGRPVARPTRRKGIKARGRSLTPARGGYGGNDGYAGEPIEREQSDVPFLRTRRVERRRIPSRRRLRLRPHQTGQLASQPLPRSNHRWLCGGPSLEGLADRLRGARTVVHTHVGQGSTYALGTVSVSWSHAAMHGSSRFDGLRMEQSRLPRQRDRYCTAGQAPCVTSHTLSAVSAIDKTESHPPCGNTPPLMVTHLWTSTLVIPAHTRHQRNPL